MKRPYRRGLAVSGSLLLICGLLFARGGEDTVTLAIEAARDNTLYQTAFELGETSNGTGSNLFAGRSNSSDGGNRKRAVMFFDVAGAVPFDANILDVSLEVFCSRSQGGPQTMRLHRVLSDWGEGTSDAGNPGGQGTVSTTGDATWIHTFHPSTFWTTPGGDYDPAVSASVGMNLPNPYAFSSAQLVADVEDMRADPAANFGWMIVGRENTLGTSKRLDSRESANPGSRPTLFVTIEGGAAVPALPEVALVLFAVALLAAGALTLSRRDAANHGSDPV